MGLSTFLCFAFTFLYVAALSNRPFVVVDTGSPPDPFGIDGFDVSVDQSVAVRFVCNSAGSLKSLELWLMSNAATNATVTLGVASGGASTPPAHFNETWTVVVPPIGWNPQLFVLNSTLAPSLQVGDVWWVVATSTDPGGNDAVWAMTDSLGFMSTSSKGAWQPGGSGGVAGLLVRATGAGANSFGKA
eukprot:gnl/Spiro4/4944_TR2465_c0_g1_i1.p2 gnl/Spiro4/4944_TR2465_c0_g1~~gnl/Spiro4/4944_TR2465_c0_g1_i1.p2  ORF type:complete len:199 (+),score=22.78 gnl/Spiro4/4944_TR2465_c0_g1_i1:34-597(+)